MWKDLFVRGFIVVLLTWSLHITQVVVVIPAPEPGRVELGLLGAES
jgi:hypothetical protein